MGNAFRRQPFPALYGSNKTPFAADLLEVGLAFACLMLFISFVLIIPGIRGWEVIGIAFVRNIIMYAFTIAFVGHGAIYGGIMDRRYITR